jgi:hypothetical protein
MSAQHVQSTLRGNTVRLDIILLYTMTEGRSFDYLNIYWADHQANIYPAILHGIDVPKNGRLPRLITILMNLDLQTLEAICSGR